MNAPTQESNPNHLMLGAFVAATAVIMLCGSSTFQRALVAADPPATAAGKVDAELTFHKDGSVTFIIDGNVQAIPARDFRKRAAELLAGKRTAVFHVEDWPTFERQADERIPDLYELGLRTITIQVTHNGKTESRTFDVPAPSLGKQILTGTPQVRAAALEKVETMLASANSNQRVAALDALSEAQQARFDRARFLPLVRKLTAAGSAHEIGRALGMLPLLGGGESDVPSVLAHAGHVDPSVRARICQALYGLDPAGRHAGIGPAIEKLLSDDDKWVRVATYKSIWGLPSTPGIDAKLIELSRGPSRGGSSEADETIYYALSTRPLVRKAVAQRLQEIIVENPLHRGRAVWGLSHHQADEETRPIAVDALIQVLDAESDRETRQGAAWGLGFHGGDRAISKLEALAANANESEAMRAYARQQLRGRSSNKANGRAAPAALAALPAQLWEQLAQPNDPELRRSASAKIVQMLKEASATGAALQALLDARDGGFERAPFVPLVRPLLASTDAEIRAQALSVLATFRNDAIVPGTVAAAARDDSPLVRRAAAESLLRLDPKAAQPLTPATIERLLLDADPDVVRAMVRSVWGCPTTVAAEKTLLDLSFHAGFSKDAIYYGLSTRPVLRKPVAERLIELAFASREHRGRAIWGLAHHQAAEEARAAIVDALIKMVDTFADGPDRRDAIHGLGRIATPKARQRLQQILDATDESDFAKTQAREQLKGRDSGK